MKKLLLAAALAATIIPQVQAANRDYIQIVGSSTVYPFATVVAEQFGRSTKYKTPKVESTGSGGGLKLFCNGVGMKHPDITNSSRAIKPSEIERCAKNGVTDIVEVKIGYDGIVLANARSARPFQLTLKDVYLALAKEVPNPNGSEGFIRNPYVKWSDIRSNLPKTRIEVLGPPPTSGTRDAFVELAMEGGAKSFEWVAALKKANKSAFKSKAHTLREDGHYIEAGENDNLIVQKLEANPSAIGIFGFSFLDQNADVIKGAQVDGVFPEFDSISDGSYPVSRSLYFYVKKAHMPYVKGLKNFLVEFVSEGAMGEDGYLADRGLIPMPADEYQEIVDRVEKLTTL